MVILFPETNHLSSVRQTTASPSRLNLMGASSAKPPLALQVGCQGRSHSILHAPSKPHHLVLYCFMSVSPTRQSLWNLVVFPEPI